MWLHSSCASSGTETQTTRCSRSCSRKRRQTDDDSVAGLEARDDLGPLAIAEACLHPVQDRLLPLEDPDLLATRIRCHSPTGARAAGSGPHVRAACATGLGAATLPRSVRRSAIQPHAKRRVGDQTMRAMSCPFVTGEL